jgi:hypothetical protein
MGVCQMIPASLQGLSKWPKDEAGDEFGRPNPGRYCYVEGGEHGVEFAEAAGAVAWLALGRGDVVVVAAPPGGPLNGGI